MTHDAAKLRNTFVVLSEAFSLMRDTVCAATPETGGILGQCNGQVVKFVFDKGIEDNRHCYVPDYVRLSQVIDEWGKNDVSFCGIVHSHFAPSYAFSESDMSYMKLLMTHFALSQMLSGLVVFEAESYSVRWFCVDATSDGISVSAANVVIM